MIELTVGGMTCEGCVRSVTRAVQRAAPDARVAVDLAGGKVSIDTDRRREDFVAAIEAAGYEVKD
jgi:copper chaperone